jgi:outer membrane protein, multidrug efflux system
MNKILLLLFLSGCVMGPSYQRPDVDIPETFHFETEDANNALDITWWRQFDDPVLEGYIQEALANNKNVQIAAANIVNAIGILIQTRASLFPQIGYTDLVSRTRTSQTAAGFSFPPSIPISITNPQTTWEALLTGSWQIDLFGRIVRQVEAAEANIGAKEQARNQIILSLVASVANTYIQLLGLDEQLAISLRTMKAYAEEVEYFTKQFDYGQASQLAIAQSETQYEIAVATIPQVKAQIVQVENALNVLLGRNPGKVARGKDLRTLQLPEIPADLPSELLHQRPDIMQAEDNLIAANAIIGATEALYFPSISLTGFYGTASSQLQNLFIGPSNTWNYAATITGPIFTAGAIYGQVVQAKAQAEAALIAYKETIQNAFADVETTLYTHTMLAVRLEAEIRLVAASGEYVRLANLQYKAGYVPYFVVIQAEQQFFPSELSWASTKADLFSSIVNVYQAMGGGWVVIAEGMTCSGN